MNQKIKPELRGRLYKSTVINVALWGCDTWALTEKNYRALEVFNSHCALRMCGKTHWHCQHYHLSIAECRDKLKIEKLESVCRLRQLRYLDKISQQPPWILAKRMLCAHLKCPPGTKCIRTPKTTQETYRDTIKEVFSYDKTKVADPSDMSKWAEVFEREDCGDIIDSSLQLAPDTFIKGRKVLNR